MRHFQASPRPRCPLRWLGCGAETPTKLVDFAALEVDGLPYRGFTLPDRLKSAGQLALNNHSRMAPVCPSLPE